MTDDSLSSLSLSPKERISTDPKPIGESPLKAVLDISISDHQWLAEIPPLEALVDEITREVLVWPSTWKHFESTSSTTIQVGFCFANDSFIAKLNRDFCGKDRSTNVLSFPSGDVFNGMLHLGEIALAVGVVTGEAQAQGKSVLEHTTHLIIHGLLHLLGFEHESKKAANEMEKLEIDIMKSFGFGNPYIIAETETNGR